MRLLARSLFLIGLFWLAAICAAPATESGQLGFSSLIQGRTSGENQDEPPPCVCKCGGEIHCAKGQWAYCECRDGKCVGRCTPGKNEPLDLAADVATVIVEREVKASELREKPDTYSPILDQLLSGKTSEGRYRLSYKDRDMGFTFTARAVSLLAKAVDELKKLSAPRGMAD